jgi:uncharacterized protein (UPF0335 family)/ribosome modulation factor
MYVERIERLEEEKAAISDDIGEVYTEAKDSGFDPKIMRAIIKERKLDEQERKEREELMDLYRHALGMLSDTPLGAAALDKVAKAPPPKGKGKTKGKAPAPVPAAAAAPAPAAAKPKRDKNKLNRDAARRAGVKAGLDGRAMEDNPFVDDSPTYDEWSFGWQEGQKQAAASLENAGAVAGS